MAVEPWALDRSVAAHLHEVLRVGGFAGADPFSKACGIVGAEEVPAPLQEVGGNFYEVPLCAPSPCVYFLIKQGTVVYVGQTIQGPMVRVGQHLAEGTKSFDSAFALPCERGNLDTLEAGFIQHFWPAQQGWLRFGKGRPVMPASSKPWGPAAESHGLTFTPSPLPPNQRPKTT